MSYQKRINKRYKGVFISTGAFQSRDLKKILGVARNNGIVNIEISPGLSYCENPDSILYEYEKDFCFLVHNYYPTPRIEFALNLASDNRETVKKSIKMCKHAIDVVSRLKAPFYSVHCGYCFETTGDELGNEKQTKLRRIPYNEARDRFVDNIRMIASYARKKNVGIAIENNVMADFAKGNKELYLGVDTNDMIDLLGRINMNNVGVLLDLAHAKVSDTYLGFGVDDMTSKLENQLLEVHISENNGKRDENLPVNDDSELLSCLRLAKQIPITIEAYNLEANMIIQQIELVKSYLNEEA